MFFKLLFFLFFSYTLFASCVSFDSALSSFQLSGSHRISVEPVANLTRPLRPLRMWWLVQFLLGYRAVIISFWRMMTLKILRVVSLISFMGTIAPFLFLKIKLISDAKCRPTLGGLSLKLNLIIQNIFIYLW